ncbi:hypothetical protein [Vibrio gallaecicus]|uniref:Uncharacterized protein n=1 Tax=Vibrio gallaecicus TaxID=552386 RepID=A0ABV4NHV9_9VIBR
MRLKLAINSVLLAVDVKFEASEELPNRLLDVLQKRDLIHSLKQKKLEDRHYGKRRALDDLVRASSELESLIEKLVPFIGYMETSELELYSVLEDILIFEYIGNMTIFLRLFKQIMIVRGFEKSRLLRYRGEVEYAHNKAFKSDSQRLAFFIPSLGFVFTVVWLRFVVALLTP